MKTILRYIENPWENMNWWGLASVNLFEALRDEIPWEQRDAPRKECFMSRYTDPYTYGKGAGVRTYTPHAFTPVVNAVLGMTDHYGTGGLDLCFANYYDGPRDHLGWHADDSIEIDHTYPIAVVSFGAEREIWTRANNNPTEISKQLLANGSLFIMEAGFQQMYQHRIPKHGALCGPRLSLTFRKALK